MSRSLSAILVVVLVLAGTLALLVRRAEWFPHVIGTADYRYPRHPNFVEATAEVSRACPLRNWDTLLHGTSGIMMHYECRLLDGREVITSSGFRFEAVQPESVVITFPDSDDPGIRNALFTFSHGPTVSCEYFFGNFACWRMN